MSYLLKSITKPTGSTPYVPPPPAAHEEEHHRPECLVQVPTVTQPDDYSCGACCAMAVGKFYGVGPNTLEEWKKALGTSKAKSTSPEMICEYLEELGLQCVARSEMTVCDLREYHELNVPVICPIQEWMDDGKIKATAEYGHWVVVIGQDYDLVFVMDPSIENVMAGEGADNAKGKMIIDVDEWEKDWFDDDLNGERFDRFGIAVFPHRK